MINSIISILSLLWILLAGTPTPKNSLHKQPTKNDFKATLNHWFYRNFYYIALVSCVILLLVFVYACFWMCGVSAVESGSLRNFVNGGVI